MDLLCELTVYNARELPRTDVLSKIDPYVVIKIDAQKFKTSKRADEDNPTWNEKFYFHSALSPTAIPSSIVKLEIWDSEVFVDNFVSFCDFNPINTDPQRLAMVELELEPTKPKYANKGNKKATVTVGITGWIHTYPKLRSLMASTPGVIANDRDQRLYAPVGQTGLYIGVEYERDAVDIKVYLTVPNPNIYLDLLLQDRQRTKIRRQIHPAGRLIYQNLIAYQELKIDDLSLNTNFQGLLILSFTKIPLMSYSLAHVVGAHGWKGSLGFETAKKRLHDIHVDEKEQEIYMSVEQVPPLETFLIVDWDQDDVDIKLGVLSTATTGTKGFDLIIDNKEIKTSSEIFIPPKEKLHGKFLFSRIFELDDVPFGSSFKDMMLYKYELRDLQQCSVRSVIPIRP